MELKYWDIVYTVWKDSIGKWKILSQKSKTIFYTEMIINNPRAQPPKDELKISEIFDFETAKMKLIENKTKEFEREIKRIKQLSEK